MIKWILWGAWVAAFCATAASATTLCGYWAGYESLKRWTGEGTTPMALNTATCLMLLGGAVMILCRIAMGEESRWLGRVLNHRKC